MKKLSATILTLILAITVLSAQDTRSFTVGLKVQPMLQWLNVEADNPNVANAENEGLKLGFSYGISGISFFNENIGLGLELRHTITQASFTYYADKNAGTSNFNALTRTLSLQYIEIPLLIHMRTNEIGYMRYFAFFGPQLGINIRARGDYQYAGSNITSEKLKVSKNINPLAAYLTIGLGTSYNLGGNTSLVGSVSFNNGFVNVWKKEKADANLPTGAISSENYSATDTKPAYMALSVGVMF